MIRDASSAADQSPGFGFSIMPSRIRVYFFLIGFYSVSFQTILLREFVADFAINELVFGIIFFLWLIGGAIGSIFGLKQWGTKFLPYGFHSLGILTLSGILEMKFLPRAMGIFPMETLLLSTKLTISVVSIIPVSVISGILFTAGYRYFTGNISTDKAYLYEVIGFAIGGLLCSLVIYPYVSTFSFMALCFLGIAAYSVLNESVRSFLKIAVPFLIALVLLFPGLDNLMTRIKWNPLELIEEYNTPYGRISVTKNFEQYDIYFDSQRIETIPDVISDELLVHLPTLQLNDFNSVLIIGGNPYTISKELGKYGFEKIKSVTIDSKLLSTYYKYSGVDNDTRQFLSTTTGDAGAILESDSTKYDLIIISGEDSQTGIKGRFYATEIFEMVSKHLNPDGVFSFMFPGAENILTQSEMLLLNSVTNSLRNTFKQNAIISGPNITFLSSNRSQQFDIGPSFYISRLDSLGLNNSYVNRGYIFDILSPFRQMEFNNRLLKLSNLEISNSFRWPVAYFYSLFASEEMLDFPAKNTILTLPQKQMVFFICAILVMLMLIFSPSFLKLRSPRAITIPMAMITLSGFTVMLLEMVSIFIFQNNFGSVYTHVASLIALFMAGSAVGLILGKIFISKLRLTMPIVSVQIIVVVLLLLCFFPAYIKTPYSGIYSIILILIAGFAGGLSFVAVTETISKNLTEYNPAYAYGYELYGAGLGALFGAPIILPVIGIDLLLYLILILNIVMSVIILKYRA